MAMKFAKVSEKLYKFTSKEGVAPTTVDESLKSGDTRKFGWTTEVLVKDKYWVPCHILQGNDAHTVVKLLAHELSDIFQLSGQELKVPNEQVRQIRTSYRNQLYHVLVDELDTPPKVAELLVDFLGDEDICTPTDAVQSRLANCLFFCCRDNRMGFWDQKHSIWNQEIRVCYFLPEKYNVLIRNAHPANKRANFGFVVCLFEDTDLKPVLGSYAIESVKSKSNWESDVFRLTFPTDRRSKKVNGVLPPTVPSEDLIDLNINPHKFVYNSYKQVIFQKRNKQKFHYVCGPYWKEVVHQRDLVNPHELVEWFHNWIDHRCEFWATASKRVYEQRLAEKAALQVSEQSLERLIELYKEYGLGDFTIQKPEESFWEKLTKSVSNRLLQTLGEDF